MSVLNKLGKSLSSIFSTIEEKNRNAAHVNRIRALLRHAEKSARKEYLALGRYYYQNLRDRENVVTEPHCAELERIEEKMDNAIAELEAYYAHQAEVRAAREAAGEIDLDDVTCYDSDPGVVETVKQAVQETKENIVSSTEGLGAAVREKADNVIDFAGERAEAIKETAGAVKTDFTQAVHNAAEEIRIGVENVKEDLKNSGMERPADPKENDGLPFEDQT